MSRNRNNRQKNDDKNKAVKNKTEQQNKKIDGATPENPKDDKKENLAKTVEKTVTQNNKQDSSKPKTTPVKEKTKTEGSYPKKDNKETTEIVPSNTITFDQAVDIMRAQTPELSAAIGTGTYEALGRYFGLEHKHRKLSADGEVNLLMFMQKRIEKWNPNAPLTIAVEDLMDKRGVRLMVGALVQDGIESGLGKLRVAEHLFPLLVQQFSDFGVSLPAPTVVEDESGQKQLEIPFNESTIDPKMEIQIASEEDIATIERMRKAENDARTRTEEQNPTKWKDQKDAKKTITSWFMVDLAPEHIDISKNGYLDKILRHSMDSVVIYADTLKIPTPNEEPDWTKVNKIALFRTLCYDILETNLPSMMRSAFVNRITGIAKIGKNPTLAFIQMKRAFPDYTDKEIAGMILTAAELRANFEETEIGDSPYLKVICDSSKEDVLMLVNENGITSRSRYLRNYLPEIYPEIGSPGDETFTLNIANKTLEITNLFKNEDSKLEPFEKDFKFELKQKDESESEKKPEEKKENDERKTE